MRQEDTIRHAFDAMCMDALSDALNEQPFKGKISLAPKGRQTAQSFFLKASCLGRDTDDLRVLYTALSTLAKQSSLDAPYLDEGTLLALGACAAILSHSLHYGGISEPRAIGGLLRSLCRMTLAQQFDALRADTASEPWEHTYVKTGLKGIRGELYDGLEIVIYHLLPCFAGSSSAIGRERALLALLAGFCDPAIVASIGIQRQDQLAQAARLALTTMAQSDIDAVHTMLSTCAAPCFDLVALLACANLLNSACNP